MSADTDENQRGRISRLASVGSHAPKSLGNARMRPGIARLGFVDHYWRVDNGCTFSWSPERMTEGSSARRGRRELSRGFIFLRRSSSAPSAVQHIEVGSTRDSRVSARYGPVQCDESWAQATSYWAFGA
jgi:hypothetical protein